MESPYGKQEGFLMTGDDIPRRCFQVDRENKRNGNTASSFVNARRARSPSFLSTSSGTRIWVPSYGDRVLFFLVPRYGFGNPVIRIPVIFGAVYTGVGGVAFRSRFYM
ncbi:hypothetical protein NDU88_005456 [Pleurodeles waltl]|uniref:Transmembrane protein n=1 Tax=Pleurodeles waltl TaxID=8319 RepID=A0AAV7NMU4_PLEWA|nr:hypothetical protein NDU88_005456 [Pleurodeles waltl]